MSKMKRALKQPRNWMTLPKYTLVTNAKDKLGIGQQLSLCLVLYPYLASLLSLDRRVKLNAWKSSLFGVSTIYQDQHVFQDAKISAAPAFEAVEYVDVQFQNSFFEESKYRGRPTPELEDAWFDLWNCEYDAHALSEPKLCCEHDF